MPEYDRELARALYIDDEAGVDHNYGEADEPEPEPEPPGESLEDTLDPSTQQITIKGKKRKKSSWVWKHFNASGADRDSIAICKLCQEKGIVTKVKRAQGSTRDMSIHLQKVHRIQEGDTVVPSTGREEPKVKYQRNDPKQLRLNWKVGRWVVLNKRPFNVVESEEFVDMMEEANPRFVVPGRKQVRNIGDKLYAAGLTAVRAAVASLWKYCPAYTADMWSALDGQQYIAVQLHAFDEGFYYKHFSTGAVPLPPPHDAVTIAASIDQQLKLLDVQPRCKLSATTDSGANIAAAIENELAHDWNPCFDHVTHNTLGDCLNTRDVAAVVAKAKSIATFFRTSPARWEQLRQVQVQIIAERTQVAEDKVLVEQELDVDDTGDNLQEDFIADLTQVLRPKVDVVTRWNSVYAMLQRLVSLRVAIESWAAKFSRTLPAEFKKLTDEEWRQVNDIVDLVGQFKGITEALQSRDNPGIVHLLPQFLRLITTSLRRPVRYSKRFSGRSIEEYARICGVADKQAVDKMVTPMQKTMIDRIVEAYVGSKDKARGFNGGRCNQFNVLYAWAITCAMDPENIYKWKERVGKHLDKLLEEGCLEEAYQQTRHAYLSEILGQDEGDVSQSSEDEQEEVEEPATQPDDEAEAGPSSTPQQQPVAGKRKRKANTKYTDNSFLSSPPVRASKKAKATKRAKRKAVGKGKKPTPVHDHGFGDMMLALVKDEIQKMANEEYEIVTSGTGGTQQGTPVKATPDEQTQQQQPTDESKLQKTVSPLGKAPVVKLTVYSDEEDDEVPQQEPDESSVTREVLAYFAERNATGVLPQVWWRENRRKYPILSNVARRNMAVRATSAESERDFSVAGQVASKYRLKLKGESVNLCTFCSLNKQYIPKSFPFKKSGEGERRSGRNA